MVDCVDHEPTRVVACYVEDPNDGPAFVAAVRALAEAGKPALVLKAGRSERRRPRGALAHRRRWPGRRGCSPPRCAMRAASSSASPAELVDRAKALLGGAPCRGRRIAVLADGGGHGVLAADLLTDAGFELAAAGGGDRRARAAATCR